MVYESEFSKLKPLKAMAKTVTLILKIFFIVLILIDVYLVFNKPRYPTFSLFVKVNRTSLIWLTFLYGGLVSKIFFNKKTTNKKKSLYGVVGFFSTTIGLSFIGMSLSNSYVISTLIQFFLLMSGILLAHFIWPQYSPSSAPPYTKFEN